MTTQHCRSAWFLIVILTVSGLVSAERIGRLVGKVVDPEGHPIPGVTVTTTCAEIPEFRQSDTTNDKGVFKVDFERANVVYLYTFEKAGLITLKVEQNWTFEGTQRQEFTMQPAEPGTLDGRPPASTSNQAIRAFNAGVVAFKATDYPTAMAKFEEALSFDPYMPQAWAALSQVHLEQKRYPEAAEAAEKAVALGSREEQVLRTRWEAYRHLGDESKIAEAKADFERFGRLAEEAKRIYNEGVALLKADDNEGAFARFQEALEADPTFQVARLALAATGLKLDRAAEAAAAAEAVLKQDPQNEQALRLRYNASLELGDEAMIVDSLVGLDAVDPVVARESLFHLAMAAFDRDDTVKAKEILGRILGLDPDHPRSHYLLGLILTREPGKESREQAKRHLERFLQLSPNDPDAATAEGILSYLKKT